MVAAARQRRHAQTPAGLLLDGRVKPGRADAGAGLSRRDVRETRPAGVLPNVIPAHRRRRTVRGRDHGRSLCLTRS